MNNILYRGSCVRSFFSLFRFWMVIALLLAVGCNCGKNKSQGGGQQDDESVARREDTGGDQPSDKREEGWNMKVQEIEPTSPEHYITIALKPFRTDEDISRYFICVQVLEGQGSLYASKEKLNNKFQYETSLQQEQCLGYLLPLKGDVKTFKDGKQLKFKCKYLPNVAAHQGDQHRLQIKISKRDIDGKLIEEKSAELMLTIKKEKEPYLSIEEVSSEQGLDHCLMMTVQIPDMDSAINLYSIRVQVLEGQGRLLAMPKGNQDKTSYQLSLETEQCLNQLAFIEESPLSNQNKKIIKLPCRYEPPAGYQPGGLYKLLIQLQKKDAAGEVIQTTEKEFTCKIQKSKNKPMLSIKQDGKYCLITIKASENNADINQYFIHAQPIVGEGMLWGAQEKNNQKFQYKVALNQDICLARLLPTGNTSARLLEDGKSITYKCRYEPGGNSQVGDIHQLCAKLYVKDPTGTVIEEVEDRIDITIQKSKESKTKHNQAEQVANNLNKATSGDQAESGKQQIQQNHKKEENSASNPVQLSIKEEKPTSNPVQPSTAHKKSVKNQPTASINQAKKGPSVDVPIPSATPVSLIDKYPNQADQKNQDPRNDLDQGIKTNTKNKGASMGGEAATTNPVNNGLVVPPGCIPKKLFQPDAHEKKGTKQQQPINKEFIVNPAVDPSNQTTTTTTTTAEQQTNSHAMLANNQDAEKIQHKKTLKDIASNQPEKVSADDSFGAAMNQDTPTLIVDSSPTCQPALTKDLFDMRVLKPAVDMQETEGATDIHATDSTAEQPANLDEEMQEEEDTEEYKCSPYEFMLGSRIERHPNAKTVRMPKKSREVNSSNKSVNNTSSIQASKKETRQFEVKEEPTDPSNPYHSIVFTIQSLENEPLGRYFLQADIVEDNGTLLGGGENRYNQLSYHMELKKGVYVAALKPVGAHHKEDFKAGNPITFSCQYEPDVNKVLAEKTTLCFQVVCQDPFGRVIWEKSVPLVIETKKSFKMHWSRYKKENKKLIFK